MIIWLTDSKNETVSIILHKMNFYVYYTTEECNAYLPALPNLYNKTLLFTNSDKYYKYTFILFLFWHVILIYFIIYWFRVFLNV